MSTLRHALAWLTLKTLASWDMGNSRALWMGTAAPLARLGDHSPWARNAPTLTGSSSAKSSSAALAPTALGKSRRRSVLGGAILAMLLGAGAVHAQVVQTISYVGSSKSPLPAAATTSIPIVVPSGVIPGDVMIALQSYNPNGAAGGPPQWTFFSGNNNGTIGGSVWYRVATSADVAGSTTYTWTNQSPARVGGLILAFRGVDNANPLASYATQANGNSTSRTAPSLTPGITNTMLLAIYAVGNGTADTLSSPTGMTEATIGSTTQGSSGILVAGFYGLWPASTATGALVSQSGSNLSAGSIAFSVALTPAAVTPLALWHTDESAWSGAAGEVLDSSGNGYNGVAQHGATTNGATPAIGGTPGTCFYGIFNGSTQYVQLPSSLPHLGSNFTITAWIYPTAASGSPSTGGLNGGRIFWDDYNYNGFALSYSDPGSQKVRVYTRNPSNVYVDSRVSLTLNQWYFVAATMAASGSTYTITLSTFNASGTLIDQQSASGSGTWSAGTGPYATIGGNADGAVEGPDFHFPGSIDEVILYDAALPASALAGVVLATHPCASFPPNHYAVSAAASALNCQATPVTITAHTSTHAAFATIDTITLTTSTGHGDWTLTTGGGIFAAGASNSGTATYKYAQGDNGNVVLSLRDTSAETVTINVTDGTATAKSGSALASEDSPITFAPTGFRTTNGSNVATAIGTQVAGVTSTQSLALQAVRTDTNTGACTSVFASGTTVNVGLAYQCNNPTACVAGQTLSLTNNATTTSLASNPNSGLTSFTTVPLKFTTANGEAPIALNYTDAGQVSLAAKYNIPLGNGAGSGNTMTGSSQFVVQPYTLKLSNIKVTSTGAVNPGASTASGTVFTAAGQAFTATVAAQNYQGSATPNFGQETSPAAVTLTPNLVLPTSGHNPTLSGAFGAYAGGAATGTAFSWPEVGIITLTPAVASYLGSGALAGTTSGNVGRFIPNAFATTLNTPVFGTSCVAGGFGYVGQPFTYTAAPVITVTALAVGGATTQNYTGSLMRLANSSLTGRTYTPTPSSPTLTLSGLPSTNSDPAIADLGTGQSTLTFSAGSGISFARGSAIAPFSANIALSINVIDSDGAAAVNPVTFGTGSGIAFSAGTNQYYGRLALRNSLGSELLDLPTLLTTQYYVSSIQGFTTNTNDVCTPAPAIAFSNYLLNLQSGETCVRDSGSPGVSGQGCAAAASSRYSATASAGAFNLILAAPGAGNSGAVTVTATAPSWLQYLWNASSGSNSSPTGMATFGVFPGSPSRVYQREVY